MNTISKKRAEKHIERCLRVEDNCKNIPADSDYVVIGSGIDKGAFRIDGRTIYILVGGTSTFFEIISNLRVFTKDGIHRGFRKNGHKLYWEMVRKLPRHISYYDKIVGDGHSRGADLVQVMLWEDYKNDAVKERNRTAVVSGSPVLLTKKKQELFYKLLPYELHSLRTEKDFVDDINAPRGLIFRRFWKKIRLYHYATVVYHLPTVKGKIDHLTEAYAIAIQKFDWSKIKKTEES